MMASPATAALSPTGADKSFLGGRHARNEHNEKAKLIAPLMFDGTFVDGNWDAVIGVLDVTLTSLKGNKLKRVVKCLHKGLKIAVESGRVNCQILRKIYDAFAVVEESPHTGELVFDKLIPERCEEFLKKLGLKHS